MRFSEHGAIAGLEIGGGDRPLQLACDAESAWFGLSSTGIARRVLSCSAGALEPALHAPGIEVDGIPGRGEVNIAGLRVVCAGGDQGHDVRAILGRSVMLRCTAAGADVHLQVSRDCDSRIVCRDRPTTDLLATGLYLQGGSPDAAGANMFFANSPGGFADVQALKIEDLTVAACSNTAFLLVGRPDLAGLEFGLRDGMAPYRERREGKSAKAK